MREILIVDVQVPEGKTIGSDLDLETKSHINNIMYAIITRGLLINRNGDIYDIIT